MPITSSEIKIFKSGSSVGLGGPISATEIVSAQMNNVFDNVNSGESATGDVEYRCIYVKNTNPSLTLLQSILWISVNTASPDTEIAVGLDPAGINNSAQVIASETAVPLGVTFASAPNEMSALDVGNIPGNGGFVGVWLRRTVLAGAAATGEDYATITLQGETTA
tara:strand:- start:3326 stop:3820 length:495 start_codon:yes stop_codon:yes gene_type:complete